MPRDWARCPLRCLGKSQGGSERYWVSARQLTEELRQAMSFAAALAAVATGPVDAQTFPSRPIRLIVTTVPGSSNEMLARAAVSAITSAEVKDKLAQQGATAIGNSPAEFAAFIQRARALTADLVKRAGIVLED